MSILHRSEFLGEARGSAGSGGAAVAMPIIKLDSLKLGTKDATGKIIELKVRNPAGEWETAPRSN